MYITGRHAQCKSLRTYAATELNPVYWRQASHKRTGTKRLQVDFGHNLMPRRSGCASPASAARRRPSPAPVVKVPGATARGFRCCATLHPTIRATSLAIRGAAATAWADGLHATWQCVPGQHDRGREGGRARHLFSPRGGGGGGPSAAGLFSSGPHSATSRHLGQVRRHPGKTRGDITAGGSAGETGEA